MNSRRFLETGFGASCGNSDFNMITEISNAVGESGRDFRRITVKCSAPRTTSYHMAERAVLCTTANLTADWLWVQERRRQSVGGRMSGLTPIATIMICGSRTTRRIPEIMKVQFLSARPVQAAAAAKGCQ